MTHEEFTGVIFNDPAPSRTRISGSSEFSVVFQTITSSGKFNIFLTKLRTKDTAQNTSEHAISSETRAHQEMRYPNVT